MKALNVNHGIMVGHAHDLQNDGYQAVLVYLRTDRVSKAMIDGLHSVGIKVGSVFEMGWPTSVSFFTKVQAEHDAQHAVLVAKLIGQPAGSQICTAVDYDASQHDVEGPIAGYQAAFRNVLKQEGYLTSVYGSGFVCQKLIGYGTAHAGWLSGSHGWTGYADYLPHAGIVQGKSGNLYGFDVDFDVVNDPSMLW